MYSKKEKKVLFGVFSLLLLVLMLTIIILLRACVPEDADMPFSAWKDEMDSGLVMDDNAEDGGLTYRSQEEIQAELNRKVEEGMINISMNTSPVFPSGIEKGNLFIVNSDSNRYPQIVYIIRKDTGEEIYRSNGIPVGSKIEYATLDVDLPAGIYDCVAYFNNADPETGAIIGTAGAEITVTVQN